LLEAIGALAALVVSLPLAGGAVVMATLIAEDPSWNPGTDEAVVAIVFLGGALISGLGTVLLALAALRRMRRDPGVYQGESAVWAVLGLWVLLTIGALSWRPGMQHTFPSAVGAAEVIRTEQILTQEIRRRLVEAGWQAQHLSVQVSPTLGSATCRVDQVASEDGMISMPFNGGFKIVPLGEGLWQIDGRGEFRAIQFSVDTSLNSWEDPTVKRAAGFEPARYVVLRNDRWLQGSFLDLETGRILSPPPEMAEELQAKGQASPGQPIQVLGVLDWMRESGADLFYRRGRAGLTLVDGVGILAGDSRGGDSAFDAAAASDLSKFRYMVSDILATHTNRQPEGLSMFWFEPREGEKTWIFRSRDRAGILEITQGGNGEPTVGFRYKLARP